MITLNIFDFTDKKFMIEMSVGDNHANFSTFLETVVQFSSWKIRFRDEIVLENLSKLLQLTYIARQSEGRVCFAESAELRPEFRTFFTTQDLKYYILGAVSKNDVEETGKTKSSGFEICIPYPAHADEFWNILTDGEEIAAQQCR